MMCLFGAKPQGMDDVQHVAGVHIFFKEVPVLETMTEKGVDGLLRIRQRLAKLRAGSAGQALKAIDRLQPALFPRGLAPQAVGRVAGDVEPAEQS